MLQRYEYFLNIQIFFLIIFSFSQKKNQKGTKPSIIGGGDRIYHSQIQLRYVAGDYH